MKQVPESTYLRWLAREINAECRNNGAYFESCGNTIRIKRASYSAKHNVVTVWTLDGVACNLDEKEIESLQNGNAQSICASRY